MTDPYTWLRAEHRRIEGVLDALEACAARETVEPSELTTFVRFFREFVDGLHHGKEEDVLFAALVEDGGMPADMGPIAVMLDEHEQGRRAVATLAELAEQAALGPDDRRLLARTSAGYASMLRHHILKEDGVLYPMAEARLDPTVTELVMRQFERLESRAPAGLREELLGLADTLSDRYRSPWDPRDQSSGPRR